MELVKFREAKRIMEEKAFLQKTLNINLTNYDTII